MEKKNKNSILDEYKKLQDELIRDKVNRAFQDDPKDWVTKLEDLGFTYFDDEDDIEESEERSAIPENRRQRNLVEYFEGRKNLSPKIFELFSEEKASEKPNYPLIRKYFRKANPNLKALLLYGLDNHHGRIDLLDDLAFFHEFENVLGLLIKYYTRACVEQSNLETFAELAQDFYYTTAPDGFEAYYALQNLFAQGTEKRAIIHALIDSEDNDERTDIQI